MSKADDILFAPIADQQQKIGVTVDFLTRPNAHYSSFDWKPVSERAHEWMHTHYDCVRNDEDGWFNHFSAYLTLENFVSAYPTLENFVFEPLRDPP